MAGASRKAKRVSEAEAGFKLKTYDWEGHTVELRVPMGRDALRLLKRVAVVQDMPPTQGLDELESLLDELVASVDGEADWWPALDGDLIGTFAKVVFGFFGVTESERG